jgi:hypothetical protein
MGLMRFIFPADRITDDEVQRVYMSGYDRIPWLINTRLANGELILERPGSESANVHIPWRVQGHGHVTLSTATLMERPDAYHFPLELARGELAQVRNQLAEWKAAGVAIPQSIYDRVAAAKASLCRAICEEHGSVESTEAADEAIRIALDATELLAGCYTEQSLAAHRPGAEKLSTFLGANLGMTLLDEQTSMEFLDSFNAASIPMVWREMELSHGQFCWDICDKQVEWCEKHGITICAGPLLQFDRHTLPRWLPAYAGDFESILTFGCQFVEAVVERYRGRVDLWQTSARLNTAQGLSLSEQERVTLAARAIELTRSLDGKAHVVVSFEQPWAEYLGRRQVDFPPPQFADALLRAGLGLSGVMLEINVGYHPIGTLPRDLLEFSRQLDYWSILGVPLFLSLCAPSSGQDDPLAVRPVRVWPEGWDARAQQSWINRHVPMFLSKSYVEGILWNQLRDGEPHELPHGGLFDLGRVPKPALRQLASLRKAYLR